MPTVTVKPEDFDRSNLIPPIGTCAEYAAAIAGKPVSSDPYAASLIPSSDLTALLSDKTLRARYRAGRYVAGKNVAVGFSGPTSPVHTTVSHIAQRCDPVASSSIVYAACLHIGTRSILSWPETAKLREILTNYTHDTPDLEESTIYGVGQALKMVVPRMPGSGKGVVTVSESIADEVGELCQAVAMSQYNLASYCMMATLVEQPEKFLNAKLRHEMLNKVEELKRWLELRSKTIEWVLEWEGAAGGDAFL